MIFILAGAILLLATRTLASDSLPQSQFVAISNNGYFYQDAIYAYNINLPINQKLQASSSTTTHSILASKPVSDNTYNEVRRFLEQKNSPLQAYVPSLLSSPYWSTIIGITAAEESFSKNPYGSNNLYGLMSHGAIIRFNTLLDGFNAENDWLASHEANHPTIESLDGYYVQPYSQNWLNTVLQTKKELEAL